AHGSDMLTYQGGGNFAGRRLSVYDRTGKRLNTLGDYAKHYDIEVSPDGRKLVIAIGDPHPDIWIQDMERGTRTRLTFEPSASIMPLWSHDGTDLFYSIGDSPVVTTVVVRRHAN